MKKIIFGARNTIMLFYHICINKMNISWQLHKWTFNSTKISTSAPSGVAHDSLPLPLPLHLLCQNLVPNGGYESSSKSCIMHYCILHVFISPLYFSFSKSWKKDYMTKFSKYSYAIISISIFSLDLIYPCAIHKRTNWSLERDNLV